MRLRAPLNEMTVTWPFGATSDDPRLAGVVHQGVDLRADLGTPVLAAADGKAVEGNQYQYGFGRYVRLEMGWIELCDWDGHTLAGAAVCYYAHLSASMPTRYVKRGEVLGWTGATGMVTGAHLHWELAVEGARYDPMAYLEANMADAEDQIEAGRQAATELRWTLEERVVRALARADDLEAEAVRVRDSVRRQLTALVSRTDGLAYRTEIILGGDAPAYWGGE
jgi:hypothetical protein